MTQNFSKKLDNIPPSGIRKFFDLVIGSKDIISLGVGEPDFVTPVGIRDAAHECLQNGLTSYTSNAGLDECRKEIAIYLKKRFGLSYDYKEEIMLSVGVSEGVDICLRALLNPGDEVIVPEPAYVCYSPLVQLAYGEPINLDTSTTGFLPDPKAIEKKITKKTKAIILCSPNNPTGMVIPKKTLEAIAKLAIKYDLWVISDEIYAELSYGDPYISIASIKGMAERCVLLSGFSKAFAMTGWRLGYVCGPSNIVSRALKIHQYAALCAPIFSQFAAIEALKKGAKDVEHMRQSYERRRNYIVKRFNDMGLKTIMPGGAFYCFPDIRSTGLNSEDFALDLLKKKKVAVVPGTAFGSSGEGYIRCCYATSLDSIKEALNRIESFLKTI